MRRTSLVLALALLLVGCLAAAGCDSLTSTTTTLVGGGSGPGDTSGVGTATTLGSTVTTLATGGTPITGEAGNTILGKWHNAVTGETLEFLPNGTVTGNAYAEAHGLTSTYAISGNQITFDVGGLVTVVDTFSIDGDTLTLIDSTTGTPGTLQRVE